MKIRNGLCLVFLLAEDGFYDHVARIFANEDGRQV